MQYLDLLNPSNLYEHYQHQLKQTIRAYNPTQIVLGEALQNAIDAIVEVGDGVTHDINIKLDLDHRVVTVTDNGVGFENDPKLLFLGGGTKRSGNRKLFGFVGVGLKVVLFSSKNFILRSRKGDKHLKFEIHDAYLFSRDSPPDLRVPTVFLQDPSPLSKQGTEISYQFPRQVAHDPFDHFIENIYSQCLPHGSDRSFGKTLKNAVDRKLFDTRFAGMLASFLRRYTYAGDVWNALGGKRELKNTSISVEVTCSDPVQILNAEIGDLFDGKKETSFRIEPEYLHVEDTASWVPVHDKPGLYHLPLGKGGTNLDRTWKGFNVELYTHAEDYERLLTDRRGNLPDAIKEYRERLFPIINGIILTIGRIPIFEEFLPGGSQRVISANGVVTTHEVDLTRGKNQEYVRCFDLVIDTDAQLNYGKSQLTDNHLVGRIRRFINDAYSATIQNAAGNWVGRIDDDDNDEYDYFLKRESLGIPELANKKAPRDENDVIALFFELVGRGYISGYQSFGLSQIDRYDGRFILRRSGDAKDPEIPSDDRQLSAIEFKVTASALIRDLEREAKDARDLKLVIAWDEGTSNSDQFGFADIEHSRYYPDKVYLGVTRYLQNTKSGSQIQILLLKTVVEEIRRQQTND